MTKDAFLQIAPYGVSIIVFSACLCMFLRLWAGLSHLRRKPATADLGPVVDDLRKSVADLEERLAASITELAMAVNPTPRGNINLNNRGQVLRMHRRGQPVPEIASVLGLRRGEVDLILKLQQAPALPPCVGNN